MLMFSEDKLTGVVEGADEGAMWLAKNSVKILEAIQNVKLEVKSQSKHYSFFNDREREYGQQRAI